MLISPHSYREWIMTFGDDWSGKSHAWLTIPSALESTKSPGKVHVIDTDFSAMVQGLKPEFSGIPIALHNTTGFQLARVIVHQVSRFSEVLKATQQIVKEAKPPHDWIIVDKESTCWETASDYYCVSRFDQTQDAIEQEYRRHHPESNDSGILRYYKHGINPMYAREFRDILMYRSGCHVVFCSKAGDLKPASAEPGGGSGKRRWSGPTDSLELHRQFESLGRKPVGQKDTASKCHTVIYLSQPYPGRFFAQTVRERGPRECWLPGLSEPFGKALNCFALQYLLGPAGWKLGE